MSFDKFNPEEKEAIKEHKERANEKPELHMAKLLKHATGYLKKHKKLYEQKKQFLERHEKEYRKNPKKLSKPEKDSFMVNYEEAMELGRRLMKNLELKKGEKSEVVLASYKEGELKKPSQVAKKMANFLWLRTVMPTMPMVSNVVIKGVRYIKFESTKGPQGQKLANAMICNPNGMIQVTNAGKKPVVYLPPFPDVEIEFNQYVA